MNRVVIILLLFTGSNLYSVDFNKDIKPILEENCLKCHNSKKDKGDLNLETLTLALKGGESGAAIVKGDSVKSHLVKRVMLDPEHDDVMPPKKPFLNKSQISLLDKWVKGGAQWPENTKLTAKENKSAPAKKSLKVEIKVPEIKEGHKFLASDKGFIKLIGFNEKVEWQHPARGVHDIEYLTNGNVMFITNRTVVLEIDPKSNKKVFEYNSAVMNGNKGKRIEVHAFQRLDNGTTMIAESGAGRIIEVDKNGKLLKQFKMKLNKPHPHKDTRSVRKLLNGNYLASHEGDGFVREYENNGKVIWEYEIPLFGKERKGGHGPSAWGNSVFDAMRLPNGNTLIAAGNGHSLLEVTPKKEIVWEVKQNDLEGITLAWVTTLQLMPNGNIMFGNCHAGPDNPQIIEITKDKKVVWSYKNFKTFGNSLSNSLMVDAIEDIAFYNNSVHPVLDKNCLKCHGHEEKEMKGGFWLESRYDTLKGGDIAGTRVFQPEKPAESALLKHIHYFDEDHQMPPKDKRMSMQEIKIITEWVARGIPFDPFKEKIAEGALLTEVNEKTKSFWAYLPIEKPKAPESKGNWARNDIDRFIQAELDKNSMKPNDETDKVSLIRRAYYDLIGLPPTVKQVDNFVKSNDPEAYEKMIDELLASKHYGEKWGRHWLDIVRFAETNSYERDGAKPHAWKFRQWVIDSFNSDKPYDRMIMEQLAGDELDHPTPETIAATGYYRLGIWDDEPADKLQALYDEYNDIVSTTSEAFMGMTVGCARCHNHKIDPIPQKDYYSMLAIFHNITPYSRGGHEKTILTDVSNEGDKQKLASKNRDIAQKRQAILDQMKEIEAKMASITGARKSDMRNVTFKFYRETWDKLPDFDMHKAEEKGKMPGNWFDISKASRKVSIGYVFEGELIVPESNQYTFLLNSDDGSELLIDGKSIAKLDGIRGMDSRPHQAHTFLKKGVHKIKLTYFQKEYGYGLYLAWKFRGGGNPVWPLTKPTGVKNKNFKKLISQKGTEVLGKKTFDKYKKLEREYNSLREVKPTNYVLSVREKDNKIPDTYIFRRGSPKAKADKVKPAFPSVLTDTKPNILPRKNSTGARRAFAEWLIKENPLTARVMANRIWQYHFGRGIVKTPNDFGNQGSRPTHPKLLEYLAASFKEGGWSIKKLHKTIMTSAAYRMSSKGNEEYLIKDPANDLFWRFNMRRLSGEELRDSILAVMGKLDPSYGGASVYPRVSKEVLAGQSKVKWRNGPESHQYRRSIYTYQMRSLIFPLVESFDAASPDTSCAVRFETTLPTQALTMMNGDLLNKSAELMAQNVRENAGRDIKKQMEYLWSRVTGRKVNSEQTKTGADFIARMKKIGASDEKALHQLCLIMLNLNEFIYLD